MAALRWHRAGSSGRKLVLAGQLGELGAGTWGVIESRVV